MINKMVIIDQMILDVLTVNVKKFLTEHTDIDSESITTIQDNSNKLTLNDYTTTISINGKLNLIIMMSFEENLVKNIADIFLDGEKVEENEKMVVYNSIVDETINIIIGLSLASFKNNGEGLDMGIPTIINDTEIKKYDTMPVVSEDLITKYGKLSISIINCNTENI